MSSIKGNCSELLSLGIIYDAAKKNLFFAFLKEHIKNKLWTQIDFSWWGCWDEDSCESHWLGKASGGWRMETRKGSYSLSELSVKVIKDSKCDNLAGNLWGQCGSHPRAVSVRARKLQGWCLHTRQSLVKISSACPQVLWLSVGTAEGVSPEGGAACWSRGRC